jgi:hypothetical protein
MIKAMGPAGHDLYPAVRRKLTFAADLLELWYLRPELMMVIARMHGQSVAEQKIAKITTMFEGLMPKGMSGRPKRRS